MLDKKYNDLAKELIRRKDGLFFHSWNVSECGTNQLICKKVISQVLRTQAVVINKQIFMI